MHDTSAESTDIHVCGEPEATAVMHSRHGSTKRKAGSGSSHDQGERNLTSQMTCLTIAGNTVILNDADKDDSNTVTNSSQVQGKGDVRGERNL